MRRLAANQHGFTLLEILIVIVILAVIAGLALPVYTSQVEKSRAQEAIVQLQDIRGSMLRYFAFHNSSYAGATIRANAGAVAPTTDIDVDPNNILGGQNQIFNYTLVSAAGTFTATATRINGRIGGVPAAPAGVNTLTINEAGTVTRTGVYT
jgi:type IV pilus assembly protein PilE